MARGHAIGTRGNASTGGRFMGIDIALRSADRRAAGIASAGCCAVRTDGGPLNSG